MPPLLKQLQPYLPLIAVLLAASLAYVFGRWKTVHDRLYERRADVIAAIFERFETLDQQVASMLSPRDYAGEPSKDEKAQLAVDSFNDLQKHYRSNSIWLSRGTSRVVDGFLIKYRKTIEDFVRVQRRVSRESDEPKDLEGWIKTWTSFRKESPEIKDRLDTEFRAVFGDHRARVRRFYLNVSSWLK
jgi:hypothetical protein